jgi:glucose/arabinose dehydrogenase
MRRVQVLVLIAVAALTAPGLAQSTIYKTAYASGFQQPVAIVQDPTARSTQYVLEQGGRIRVVRNGVVLPDDFLNLTSVISSGGERGLLGMALAPDYATSGRLWVNFTNPAGHTVVARFKRSSNPLIADPSTRFDLRWNGPNGPAYIAQPFANHNGGHLAFGPDNYLYVGMGDGGSANDPGNRAQNPSELLGKLLRIDVNVSDDDAIGYRIPTDNPFRTGSPVPARGEVWAFGLRNPWRFTFDSPARGGNGAMLIADVGQGAWEEVDYEPPGRGGRNYGWRNREGAHDGVTSLPPAFTPLVEPIEEYDHSTGQSITGGYVYRGNVLPAEFRGRYFYADFIQGRIWSIALTIGPNGEARASDRVDHTAALSSGGAPGNISSFGLDADGELFLVSYSRGIVFRIRSGGPPTPSRLRTLR